MNRSKGKSESGDRGERSVAKDATSGGSKPEDDLDFDELYREFAPRIRAFATSRLCDAHLAEDVVQETLIKAYKYQSARDQERPIWPWLWKIASNACSDLSNGFRTSEYPSPEVEKEERLETSKPGPEELYLASEREATTLAVLASLRPRYQHLLMLKHVEGWSADDIAELEKISRNAVELTLKRARRLFRSKYAKLAQARGLPENPFTKRKDGSVIGGFLVPGFFTEALVRLRYKIREINGRIGQLLNDAGATLSAHAGVLGGRIDSAIAVGIAIAIGLGGAAATTASPSSGVPRTTAVSPEMQMVLGQRQTAASPKDGLGGPPAPIAASDMAEIVQHKADEFDLDPTKEETPEGATMTSMVVSPNYENDHTVYASGQSLVGASLLFVTRNGGASWERLPALGHLESFKLMLPSSYPQDGRIFSATTSGLQESADGGKSFHFLLVLPLDGLGAEISPNFGKGDSWFLLSTSAGLVRYDRDLNEVMPNPLSLPTDGLVKSLAVAPSLSAEPIVLAAVFRTALAYLAGGYGEKFPYRCQRGGCEKIESYQGSGLTFFKYSPEFMENGVVYLSDYVSLYISSDRGRNFRMLPVPQSPNGFNVCCYDLVALSSITPSRSSLIGAGMDGFGSVYRSLDGGNTWSSSKIDLPNFQSILGKLIATPTGRVFASGMNGGIACSIDGGLTWARRCSPEQ